MQITYIYLHTNLNFSIATNESVCIYRNLHFLIIKYRKWNWFQTTMQETLIPKSSCRPPILNQPTVWYQYGVTDKHVATIRRLPLKRKPCYLSAGPLTPQGIFHPRPLTTEDKGGWIKNCFVTGSSCGCMCISLTI